MTSGEVREIAVGSTSLAFPAMHELRPHLRDADELVTRIDGVQRDDGYRLAGVFVEGVEHAVSVAGFRVLHNLVSGRFLYVDDLVTLSSERGQGHARRLMEWLIGEARRLGCDQFQLDSAPHRHSAHRLYLTSGMDITSLHFGLKLSGHEVDNLGES